MHNIETYSRYLHQLVKEGKYENVLINFRENAVNFSKEEISGNTYLIADLLKCYREQGESIAGLMLVRDYDIDVFRAKETILINQFGWLLHSILKGADEINATYDDAAFRARDFLCKISFQDESNRLLIIQLLVKVIGYEKKQKPVKVENLLKLLKSINIKHDAVKSLIASDAYVLSGMIDIFRKSGHVERALGFMKFLSVDINDKTPEQILNSYGWCLYTKLKTEMNDEEDDHSDTPFDSLLIDLEQSNEDNDGMLDLHPTNETLNLISNSIGLFAIGANYSPFSKLFNLSLKAEKQKSNPNWQWMSSFLLPFKGKALSTTCDTIEFMKAGKMKKVELASDLETWYAYYSLSLLKQKKYLECIDISKEAVFSIENFHYNNELWFARKIALSNKGLGNISQAINEMEAIEKRKGEWFIQKELAELYLEAGDLEKAKEFGCKGALGYGDKEKKDGLFFILGKIFKDGGNKDLAFKHFLLVHLIREEQGWFVPNRLKLALEEVYVEGIKFQDSATLYKELLKSWREYASVTEQRDVGKIVKVHVDRKIGSIQGRSGNRYFFRFNDFKDRADEIAVGVQVAFMIKAPKEDRPGMDRVAFNIRLKR